MDLYIDLYSKSGESIQVINAHPISIEEFVQLRSEIEAGSCASSDFGETDWLVFHSKSISILHQIFHVSNGFLMTLRFTI